MGKLCIMAESNWFSQEDLKKIEAAVKASESGISGEIVPVFVNQAGDYPVSAPRSAFLGMAFTLAGFLIWDLVVPGWGLHDPVWITLLLLGGALITWLADRFSPAWRRWMIGRQSLADQAFSRADQWFLNEEVFKTIDRTGIMIFVARFEHQVIIKADKGISNVVPHEEWQEIVDDLVKAIKAHHYTEGMVTAINRCAELLREKGMNARPDDTNELSNSLRME